MSLRNWLDNRWLVEHKPSPEEEVYDMAIELRRTVIEWLGGNHPDLLGD